jgi:hypothetical protein
MTPTAACNVAARRYRSTTKTRDGLDGAVTSSDNRADLSHAEAARLVLSDHAAQVADAAAWLVTTRTDADTAADGRVSQARQVIQYAQRLLTSAVVYERERGTPWSDIARYLDTAADLAQAEFEPYLSTWSAVFEDSDDADDAATRRVSHPLRAVKEPEWIGNLLDVWARHHLDNRDPHQVTENLGKHNRRSSDAD